VMVSIEDSMPGDVTGDGVINILDVVLAVSFILETESPTSNQFAASDLNNDGELNILDIVILLDLILQ